MKFSMAAVAVWLLLSLSLLPLNMEPYSMGSQSRREATKQIHLSCTEQLKIRIYTYMYARLLGIQLNNRPHPSHVSRPRCRISLGVGRCGMWQVWVNATCWFNERKLRVREYIVNAMHGQQTQMLAHMDYMAKMAA